MKNNIKLYVGITIGFIMGITCLVYANTYNSSEISYDNSISHAEATNIKDAIDWLYTNAGMKGECPEDMTCIESPVVTLNVEGPGSVSSNSVHVRISGSTKFKVKPNSGNTLDKITCDNGYTLSSFKTATNSSREEAGIEQEITITNPGKNEGGSCEVRFMNKILCKRATTLHTQVGKTFGSLGTSGILSSGDAFDCDVNGDGTYNATNERFYYITDLENDSNKAVLLYYSNTSGGVTTPNRKIAYNSSGKNHLGPVTAKDDLPSIDQWKTTIYSNPRQITNENGGTTASTGTTIIYNYGDRAARLLTAQEIRKTCGRNDILDNFGCLNSCNYLMENTYHVSTSLPYGFWLETPDVNASNYVWIVRGHGISVARTEASNTSEAGARPAIEVLKSEISY